jgi:hypothetical protein
MASDVPEYFEDLITVFLIQVIACRPPFPQTPDRDLEFAWSISCTVFWRP